MSTSLAINSATKDVNHADHIICCKKPGSGFQKQAAVINGAVGLGLTTWGMAEVIQALSFCGAGLAAWYGAGIVLLALAAILWIAYTVIQYKAAENKENGMQELKQRNIELTQGKALPVPGITSAASIPTTNPYVI